MCGFISNGEIEQLVAGELQPSRRKVLNEHLSVCRSCQSLASDATSIADLDAMRRQSIARDVLQYTTSKLPIATRLPTAVSVQKTDATTHDDVAAAGQKIDGRYRILRLLGHGGMGVVYLAEDERLRRQVAVKLIRADRMDRASRKRFVREARAVAAIDNEYVVRLYSVSDADDAKPYLVMQLIEGRTLAEHLSDNKSLDVREAARIVAQVALGLSAAHRAGLVHRDVKPSNIMLDDVERQPKITDFGLVLAHGPRDTTTRDGATPGTPEYMSPEQIQSPTDVDARTDIYSLGQTLYELLTGTTPFCGSPHQVLQQVLTEDPPPPTRLNDQIPKDLETICLKAIEKDPERRYQSASDFAADLCRWLRSEPIVARPLSPFGRLARWRASQPLLANLVATIVLVVCVSFLAVVWQWTRAERSLADALEQKRQAELHRDEALRQQREKEAKTEEARQQTLEKDRLQQQLNWFMLDSQLGQSQETTVLLVSKLGATQKTIYEIETSSGDDRLKRAEAAGYYLFAANLQRRLGDLPAALRSYSAAETMFRERLETDPHSSLHRQALATTLYWSAIIKRELGDKEGSLATHEQSQQLREQLRKRDRGVLSYSLDLANSHIAIGDLHAVEGEVQLATEDYVRAYTLLFYLEIGTQDRPTADIRNDITVSFAKLVEGGRRLGLLDHSKALCEQALHIAQPLVNSSEYRRDWRANLAHLQNLYGELSRDTHEPAYAEAAFEYAVENQRQVVQTATRVDESSDQLRTYLANLCLAHQQQGRVQEAIDVALERQGVKLPHADHYYWTACQIAACIRLASNNKVAPRKDRRAEYSALTVASLKNAIDLGFDDRESVTSNPDFELLTNRDELDQLLRTLQKSEVE